MYVPRMRERVQVAGRNELFLVVWVDEKRETADLIPLQPGSGIEQDVPFSQIEPYRENIPN